MASGLRIHRSTWGFADRRFRLPKPCVAGSNPAGGTQQNPRSDGTFGLLALDAEQRQIGVCTRSVHIRLADRLIQPQRDRVELRRETGGRSGRA